MSIKHDAYNQREAHVRVWTRRLVAHVEDDIKARGPILAKDGRAYLYPGERVIPAEQMMTFRYPWRARVLGRAQALLIVARAVLWGSGGAR